MIEKEYKISMDALTRVLTFGTCVVLVVVNLGLLGVVFRDQLAGVWFIPVFGLCSGIGIFTICYLYYPQKYKIDRENLTIVRRVQPIEIPRREIVSVRRLEEGELWKLRRRGSINGLFGYAGSFYHHKLGKLKVYTRRLSDCVLLDTRTMGRFILSPDDMGFVEEVGRKAQSSTDL